MTDAAATRAPRTGERIGRGDPRYAELAAKRFNKRFAGNPDTIVLVGSTEETVAAVQDAVREDARVVARSGGHCLEGFVANPAVRVIVDTSPMSDVAWDPVRNAFAVGAGATLGRVWERLSKEWGVLLPAGESPDLGVGGHVPGGGFGFLCRDHGLAADHLEAVEVVVVDADGTARSVVASRDPSDPAHDLWWAHTGGGGGSFGIATRFWFRSRDADGAEPGRALPKAPESVALLRAEWSLDDVGEGGFTRLVDNFGAWSERNAAPDAPGARVFSTLFLRRREYGKIELKALTAAGAKAEELLEEHLASVADGVDTVHTRDLERTTWLEFALHPFPELFAAAGQTDARLKGTDAFLRRRFDARQVAVAYRHLTRTDLQVPGGMLGFATYGGKVNAVPPDATASPHRDSILTMGCVAGWMDPREEAGSVRWVREFYRDVFADTGGVPVPGGATDGAMINHPDVDLADPEWNCSGVPWPAFYFKDNYPRLQRIKARWDPRNVFHHALSVRLPSG